MKNNVSAKENADLVMAALSENLLGMCGTKSVEAIRRAVRKAVTAEEGQKTVVKLKLTICLEEGVYALSAGATVSQTVTDTMPVLEKTVNALQGVLPFDRVVRAAGSTVAVENMPGTSARLEGTEGTEGTKGPEADESGEAGETSPTEVNPELFERAVQVVKECRRASVSGLQRRLKIGFAMAARIMDLMEERGMVSPPKPGGTGARDILDLEGAAV